jgi:hypothetical protein
VAELLPTDLESLLGQWVPLNDLLPKLRECMAVNDGGVFILRRWDCKYIDIRLDMRIGTAYAKPGSNREGPHCSTCSCGVLSEFHNLDDLAEIERLHGEVAQLRTEYAACIATVDRLENGPALDVPAKHVCVFTRTGGPVETHCVLCGAPSR